MRDVILAAASEAADATLVPARETSGPAEPHDDIAAQLTQVRSAGEAEGIRQGSARLDSGARCNRSMKTGFARLCQAL